PAVDLVATTSGGHFNAWQSRVSGLPEYGGELPVAALAEEMLTPGEGQVRALVTVAGNPVLSTPNGRQLDAALEGLEFMLSIDLYINETTRHADLI
ncbi:molybdopterin oxidoreductase family protein, partial [Pseudomonas sp. SIMBA_064]